MVAKSATIRIDEVSRGRSVDREPEIILKLQADVLLLNAMVHDLQARVAKLEPASDAKPLRDLT